MEWLLTSGKGFLGSGRGLTEALSRDSETSGGNSFMTVGVPSEFWSEHIWNTSQEHYRHANPLST
jgi:hypothetical protein